MWFAALLDYKGFILRSAGIALIAVGLCLKGTFFLVQTLGATLALWIVAALIGVPLLWLFWIRWQKAQSRVGLFLIFVVCFGIYAGLHSVAGPWVSGLTNMMRDSTGSHADMLDYFSHPGDTAALWRAAKFDVMGRLSTGMYLPGGTTVQVFCYGGGLELKVGKQSCRATAEKQQTCRFLTGGDLVLDSEQGQSQAYLKGLSDRR